MSNGEGRDEQEGRKEDGGETRFGVTLAVAVYRGAPLVTKCTRCSRERPSVCFSYLFSCLHLYFRGTGMPEFPRTSGYEITAGPVLVSSDMRPSKAYDFVSKLRTDQFLTRVVVDFMKSQDVPYKQDTKLSKNYNQFLQTKTGELWQDIDRLLSVLHPTFNRLFIRMKVMSDSLIEHLSSIGHVDAAKVYNALEDWNSDQYREDIKSSQKWVDFCSKESGILLLTIVKRLSGLPFPAGLQPTEIPSLQNIIEKDILDYHSGQQSTT
ncbi:hypothetical protein F5878DRAFT_664945 [Lentinula raphanica]|uniref:Uncharacterized protein n=1 Tax=Lentinula raphanica TaxID=153919 RepID=A0AA38P0U9_9AGAR|nr:hypothetical protein F5878DRAFT_664945 [Lentinula raphanica]